MKLHRLRIEHFRKFAAAIEIGGLEQGLNVLYGPNEAGKSTIAQALRTLFFERHNTRGDFVRVISPAGMSDAAPSIEADFSLAGERCAVSKTFFQKPRAQLSIDGKRWEAGEADEELAARLGFGLSGRGSSRAETHGIPGLLWIEQGASADLATPVANASASLEERLKSILGDMTSSAGNRLATAVQAELRKLRTATGKSSGVLAETEKTLAEASQLGDRLRDSADEYRALSDQVARKIQERDQLERDKPWEAYAQRKREAEAHKVALEPQQRALQLSRQNLRELDVRIDGVHEQNRIREKDLRALQAQREQLANGLQTRQQAGAALTATAERRGQARDAVRLARAQQRSAEQRQHQASLHADLLRIRAEIERIEGILAKSAGFGESMAELRAQAAALHVAKADLGQLAHFDQALRDNRIQREAIATRVVYRLQSGQSIDAGALGRLDGSGSRQISAPLTLRIAGVGEIDIAPGGEDLARLSDQAERLHSEFGDLCTKIGVKDLADAQARRANALAITQHIALQEKERDTLLDEHSDAQWRARLAEAQGQRSDREQRLDAAPVGEEGLPAEEARRLCDDAEAQAKAAEDQHERQQKLAADAELACERLQAHVDAESRRLDSEEARAAADQRSRDLAETVVRRAALEKDAGAAEAVLAERKPELIEADIQRNGLALATVEKQRRDLRESIGAMRAKLEALGADGLDEKLDSALAHVANLQRRVAQYELRARALALLGTRLAARQDAASQRLYAPLRAKLTHYLEILFPATPLAIGVDQLRPTALDRGGRELALEEHSHGTREQLGVIARFAYADLLKEAGQPTLLILDDALVHSDAERRQQMKRILHNAAQRHQILLFTCHPEEWRDAGATVMIDVAGC